MRYAFEMQLHSIRMKVPYTVSVQLCWKKDHKRAESKTNPMIGGAQGARSIDVGEFQDEMLQMISSMYRSPGDESSYAATISKLTVKVTKGEKQRSVGEVSLNLADFVDGSGALHGQRLKLPIEKCPDKTAYVEITVTSQMVSGIGDTMSTMSGLDNLSVGSEPDSEFNFADLNSRAGLKKKKTLLRDAPEMMKAEEDVPDIDVTLGKASEHMMTSAAKKRMDPLQNAPAATLQGAVE